MQRNIVLGILGFDVIDPTAHEAALNEELIFFKIEVVPLKRRDLADAKTEALGDIHHRAIRFFQCRHDKFELAHSKRSGRCRRFLPPFMRTNAMGFLCSVNNSQRVAHSYIRCITLQMNLGKAARRLAEGPERSPLYSFGKGQRVLVIDGALTQTEELAPLRSYRCTIHCILLRSLKVILPGLRNSIRRR
jgi:hypothetical protein